MRSVVMLKCQWNVSYHKARLHLKPRGLCAGYSLQTNISWIVPIGNNEWEMQKINLPSIVPHFQLKHETQLLINTVNIDGYSNLKRWIFFHTIDKNDFSNFLQKWNYD